MELPEDQIRVGHLWDPIRTDEGAGLDDGEPCGGQALDELDLRLHGQDLALVLEPIAGSHLDHPNPRR